ncbi:MAG: sigma-70 family RNA polymerase sigma factor [Bacteroidetes bacterium]|nr:sigma-70 family RNA polymerase sigma factor [Bacteroidota bacterium]
MPKLNQIEQIIEACRKGDEKAQLHIFREYGNMALRLAWRYVSNEDDAREVMQLSMIKVFEHIKDFKGQSELKTWISRIVINQSLNFLRNQKKFAFHVSLSPAIAEETEDIYVDDEIKPSDILEAFKLLQSLPELHRLVFNLFVMDGMSHQEIGKMLGMTEANSRQVLMRARKMLHRELSNKTMITKDEQQKKYR